MAARIDSNVSIKGDPFDPILSFHDTPDGFVVFIDRVAMVFDSFKAAREFFLRVPLGMDDWNEEVQWRAQTSGG